MASVTYTHVAATKIRAWGAVASRIGWGTDFAAEVQEMDDCVRTDPEAWGDPVKDYPGARLTVYHRYGPLLVVKYAVHINGSPVFVIDVFLIAGTDLHSAVMGPSP